MIFRNKYAFLSNMYVLPDGKSVEHYFQWYKCVRKEDAELVLQAASPAEAKRLGRKVVMRSDWESVKEEFMLRALRYKFTEFPELGELLISTGSEELVEENWWNDRYWGVDVNSGIGQNKLGKLLMLVREEIK